VTHSAAGVAAQTSPAAPSPVAHLLARLAERGSTVAVAESLTGGLVTATLTEVPGSSAVVRGGVVAYATAVKADVLGVGRQLLAQVGPVSPDVAAEMASKVRDLLGATYGLATTGVAGPDPQDDHPVGEVHVAVAGPSGTHVRSLAMTGTRAQVRLATVDVVLELLADALEHPA